MLIFFETYKPIFRKNDVIEWIIKKALQGSKNDSWDILSITTNLFYYFLFITEETINQKKISFMVQTKLIIYKN